MHWPCALLNNATVALSSVTHLNLGHTMILLDEIATVLAVALRRQTLPSLRCLQLAGCGIYGDAFAALISSLEENETLEVLDVLGVPFSVRGYLALASSLLNIKLLRQIDFSWTTFDPPTTPAFMEGFRKNTSLHDVNILGCEHGNWS
jgi:hypothetical protein